jgi:adenylosuccinate lyase
VIERYTLPEMGAIWSERNKIDLWLAVEKAVCEAWAARGVIPPEAMPAIRRATCDLERMKAIEGETDHDVIAFLRATGETAGDAARFIHLGLTSSDVVDTALALQMAEAADLIIRDIDAAIETVGRQAVLHRHTLMIGRTHGVHAEPITFGFKLAGWYDDLRRARLRVKDARDAVAVGKISGATGTHANVPPDVEEDVCRRLNLEVDPVSTQIVQRDRHAHFLTALAILASTIDRFAVEIRHLARTEVRELEEPFDPGNQGSSAMPHKRNPHESERLSGLARLVRGYAITALENVALWHERDISHSSAERVILPDACILVDFMLHSLTDLVGNWVVYPERMRSNLEATGGAIFSQQALLALVEAGVDRQVAYKIVQRAAMHAWDDGGHLRDYLREEPEVASRLSGAQIDALFDYDYHLRYVDVSFERLGLLELSSSAASWTGESG